MKIKTLSLLRHLVLPSLSILAVTTACGRDTTSEKHDVIAPVELALHSSTVKPLAETSIEKGCIEIGKFILDFHDSYLPDSTLQAVEDADKRSCTMFMQFDKITVYKEILLSNSQVSLDLTLAYTMYLDADKNFDRVYTSVIRMGKDRSENAFIANPHDQLIGDNIVHLHKTFEGWAKASKTTSLVLDKPYKDYVAALLKNFGPSSERDLIAKPKLRLELNPSVEDASKGTVKFIDIDQSYFEKAGAEGVLGCKDITCLNDEVTYQVWGTILTIWSKPVPSKKGNGSVYKLFNIQISQADIE